MSESVGSLEVTLNNGAILNAYECEWYLVSVCFTARPEGKVTSDEKNRATIKSTGRAECTKQDLNALQAKTTDKNLTTKSRPDCFNSLSSRVFYF